MNESLKCFEVCLAFGVLNIYTIHVTYMGLHFLLVSNARLPEILKSAARASRALGGGS